MSAPLTAWSLPLLLLLLQPPPLQVLIVPDYHDPPEVLQEKYHDYLAEIYGTGPTKPPTKKSFQSEVIADPDRPLHDSDYCTSEIKAKNAHNRLYCRKEHHILQATYGELQETCSSRFVPCKNGVKKCHKTKKRIEGVYCVLTDGNRMPLCRYETFFKKGYALITCRWEDGVQEMIPAQVNHILET